jgi:hypothetical protein
MMLRILANVELPSAIVASLLIICPTIFFTAVAMRHTIRDVEKLAGYFASAFGVLLGVFITYFFTREATQTKIQAIQTGNEAELRFARTELNAYRAASDAVKTKLSPEDGKWFDEMIYMPTVNKSQATPAAKDAKWQYQIYRNTKSPTPMP